jgi:hypothetical protein
MKHIYSSTLITIHKNKFKVLDRIPLDTAVK